VNATTTTKEVTVNNEQEAAAEVVDAVVVEEVPEQEAGMDMVPAAQGGVMMPFDAEEVQEAMTAYQQTVRATLSPSDWQGSPGGRGSFVKKSGWRKIAKAFGLSVTRVDDGVERDEDGNPVRAWAVYRAAHPNGQTQDGDGYCSVDESRFSRSGGRQKLENDLRATATTRAKNRAISDLVGMGEVSAEEVAVMAAPEEPAYEGDLRATWEAIEEAVGLETAANLHKWILADNSERIPRQVGRALVAIGRCLTPAEPGPADDNEEVPF
jgi:hypothetical protein